MNALVPLKRLGWACVSAFAVLLLQPLFTQPIGWGPPAIVLALATITAWRLYEGFLVLAGLGPLAAVMFVVTRSAESPIRYEEALVLGFLGAWAARRAIRPQAVPLSPALRWTVALLAATAVTSAVVTTSRDLAEQPAVSLTEMLWMRMVRESTIGLNPILAALLPIEGLLLLVAAADATAGCREKRDRALQMMVVGAAAAALGNLLRLTLAAAHAEHVWSTLVHHLARVRVNIHFPDLNAAGSYFSMLLFVSAGFIGRAPTLAVPCTIMIGLAVWMSGSRIALAAVVVTACLAALLAPRRRFVHRSSGLVGVVLLVALVAVAWWKWYPEGRNVNQAYALSFRIEMASAGLKMAATAPVWGVGLGRFHATSEQYASLRENAHNQFVQVLAELGIVGLLMFLSVLVLCTAELYRAREPAGPSWGVLAGLSAFVLTAIGGHPLLVHGASYPFFILLGLAAATTAPAIAIRPPVRRALAVALLVIVGAVPFRALEARRGAYLEHASIGLSQWHHDAEGYRYRWAGGRSTIFVVASAEAVRLPLRHGPRAPTPLEVRILVDGREADRIRLSPEDGWRTLRLLLPRRAGGSFRRVDLEAFAPGSGTPLEVQPTSAAGVLMVGRAAVQ